MVISFLFQGCNGCSGISVTGDANARDDEIEDELLDKEVAEPEQEDSVEPDSGCDDDDECDDLDPCTEDSCDMDSGTCLNEPIDADNDGYPAAEIDGITCDGTDCDDLDDMVHPGAEEIECDGVDNDCDGSMSPIEDEDSDGYVNADCAAEGQEIDCDDTDDSIYPGAPLQCDGLDHDCSGLPDRDEDEDGYWSEIVCPEEGDDCDDTRADVYPGAPEVCLDGIDQDCDGLVDGPMLMIPKVMLSDRADLDLVISMVWTGSEFGVAWTGDFTRISEDGIKIEDEIYSGMAPSIAWTGSEFAIAYERYFPPVPDPDDYEIEIYLKRIGVDGNEIEEDIALTDTGFSVDPVIVWTGSEFGLAGKLYGRTSFYRVSPDGTLVNWHLTIEDGYRQDLAWTGSRFGIAWTTLTNIFFNWISADGTETGSEVPLALDTDVADYPKTEWTGSEFGVVWLDMRSGSKDINFTRLNEEGVEVIDEKQLTDSVRWLANPTLEWAGSQFGMAWQQGSRDEGYNTYFRLVSAMGNVIGEKVKISDIGTDWTNNATTQIAWTGSEFGIVWVEGLHWDQHLYFSRIGLCD